MKLLSCKTIKFHLIIKQSPKQAEIGFFKSSFYCKVVLVGHSSTAGGGGGGLLWRAAQLTRFI